MGLLQRIQRRHSQSQPARTTRHGHVAAPWLRRCRFEQMEQRQLLAVDVLPIHIGGVYYEDANGDDLVADQFEITFEGGAPGTQLIELIIQTDKNSNGHRDEGECFFDTLPGGSGAFGSVGMQILEHNGFEVLGFTVEDGGDTLRITLSGFEAGETLLFSVDV
ncbi:MAG TPA: hypothetical protein VJL29_13015, partial [Thermoguttaceae bacterium]|nr:hypothetical protein [Thermoguttaceae bacterium]